MADLCQNIGPPVALLKNFNSAIDVFNASHKKRTYAKEDEINYVKTFYGS